MTTGNMATEIFQAPSILLAGPVDYEMYRLFRDQLNATRREGLVVIELSTLGGDPEVARIMGEDVRAHTENTPQTRYVFLGKAAIYSAGTTFMSFFCRENRFLSRGTRLMVHERQMHKNLKIEGPLTSIAAVVRASLSEIESSIKIQNEGFENLVRGSNVALEEVLKRANANWYIEAEEALSLKLIEGVI